MDILKRNVVKIAYGWIGEDAIIHINAVAQVGVRFEPRGKASLLSHIQYHLD